MRVGLISDSHDHERNLRRVLEHLAEAGVEAVVHCGDFCTPPILRILDGLEVPVHGVFGNMDGERELMTRVAEDELTHVRLHGETAEIELGGWRVGASHYPTFAEGLASSGHFDLVVYGHTHVADERRVGECRLVNPGEVLGRKGTVGFAIADTGADEVSFRILGR